MGAWKDVEGTTIIVACARYWYKGYVASAEADDCIKLTGAELIYVTGPLSEPTLQSSEPLTGGGGVLYIPKTAIEAFGVFK
jgi:hypothetical protein